MGAQTTDVLWEMPALALALGYLLGSIPFGLILTRLAGAGDLRAIGSGNIGATNVLRTGRKGLAAATLLLDALKGAAAVWLGEAIAPGGGVLGAAGAFFGHCYPIWLRFKGGKGAATFGGIGFAAWWAIGLSYLLVWVGVLALSRYSSVGSLAAALAAPIAAFAFGRADFGVLFIALALIVFWRHRGNIARLFAGTEPKVGRKSG
ncbi:glycerol-3-phosphate 1-O-acyltransferase PlsY [Sphingomonas sp. MAH-20]|uniref:Glycerol-3-phosphate acyltransferase n=1 Tax=Sphingomonas horti TaxID=2682842 RepID=A0A6I4J129_9SPHN|nr:MULTISPECIES: glycerol-3-phosphate 1-O-acyltransferase PlsY [Sphingomonas]MBA2919419.1 glycerol-3-phosphate 1-O-acyltransferase PlsY [Sphingomonas sp. CGMCC 1.13658]MVO78299.1 glycerol-3-phosphate 1-O-acyltransferase PlsY [Sphingomonas horti]